jgi:hypothetical protein
MGGRPVSPGWMSATSRSIGAQSINPAIRSSRALRPNPAGSSASTKLT